MSRFRAINGQPSSSSSAAQGYRTTPGRPDLQDIVSSKTVIVLRDSSSSEPWELRDREFTIALMTDKRTSRNEEQYKVRWKECVIGKRFLNHREDGRAFVWIGGEEWDVKKHIDAGLDEDDHELCEVEWCESWQSACELPNAQEAIAEFEAKQNSSNAAGSSTSVQRSVESVARARHVPNTSSPDEIEIEPPTPRDDLAQYRQMEVHIMRFKPSVGVDYRVGFRERVRDFEGNTPIFSRWTQEQERRALLFRHRFVERGSYFDATRSQSKRAAFAYICGVEQPTPCESCQRECGPFVKCVVAAGFANGACANCAYYREGKRCNFHQGCGCSRPGRVLRPS